MADKLKLKDWTPSGEELSYWEEFGEFPNKAELAYYKEHGDCPPRPNTIAEVRAAFGDEVLLSKMKAGPVDEGLSVSLVSIEYIRQVLTQAEAGELPREE